MVEVRRLPDTTLVTVRCLTATLDAVTLPTGLAFPRHANRAASSDFADVLWTGPDDWLVIVREGDGHSLLDALVETFAGTDSAVVETSGNRVRLRVSGPGARALMARACSLDLDPPHFLPGHCAGTLVARTQAYVLQQDEQTYDLLVRRSFADYLEAWLLTAAQALPA